MKLIKTSQYFKSVQNIFKPPPRCNPLPQSLAKGPLDFDASNFIARVENKSTSTDSRNNFDVITNTTSQSSPTQQILTMKNTKPNNESSLILIRLRQIQTPRSSKIVVWVDDKQKDYLKYIFR